jgi:acyl dehydratase
MTWTAGSPAKGNEWIDFPSPGWATILLPYVASPATITFHASVLAVYNRVRWTAIPRFDPNLRSSAELLEAGLDSKGRTRSRYLSVAKADGVVIAESELVTVDDRPAAASIANASARPPALPAIARVSGGARQRGSFILSERQVGRYTRGYRGRFPSSSDFSAAKSRGLAGAIVPGELILEACLPYVTAPSSGHVEVWFMKPVPAGAVVTVWSGGDPSTIELRLMSSPHPVAAVRSSLVYPRRAGLE